MATSRKTDAGFFDQKWVDDLVANGDGRFVLLFLFLVVTCRNNVGIFEVNPRLWNFKLNPTPPFKGEEAFTKFGKRVRRIEGHSDKGIIVGFCDFQRSFSQKSAQWQWVVKDLASVGLTYEDLIQMDKDAVQQELDLGIPPPIAPNKERVEKEVPQRSVIPPQVEWVREYCSTRNNGIDAQQFCDFYSSKGWKIGKERMKDWQAAVRTWEQRRKEEGVSPVSERISSPVRNVVGNVRRKF